MHKSDRKNAQVGPKNAQVEDGISLDKAEIPQDKGDDIERRLLLFCSKPRGMLDIMEYLGYKDRKSARNHIHALVMQGRIAMTVPDKTSSKNQKYITIK